MFCSSSGTALSLIKAIPNGAVMTSAAVGEISSVVDSGAASGGYIVWKVKNDVMANMLNGKVR